MHNNKQKIKTIDDTSANVEKGTIGVFTYKLKIEDKKNIIIKDKEIEEEFPKDINPNDFLPSLEAEIIKCEYYIKVSVHFE